MLKHTLTCSFVMQNTIHQEKKTLITCHANADFDALCALIGVSLLFPHAQLVFPGTQEKVLQEFYEDFISPLFTCVSPKEADFENIERLVIVDTHNPARLSHIKILLEQDIEIFIWDHHALLPQNTIHAKGGTHALVGASCTLITEELKKRDKKIPCFIASLLGIGIYVDTGAFTYSSTTSRDLMATAWLLEQGFLPEIVSPYTSRNLTREQFSLLNTLVDSAQIIDAVAMRFILAYARVEEYVNDLASLISPFLDMNPCKVLFLIVDMGEGVQVIARSKDETFDVAKICRMLGGGGHAYAASAMVKDMILPEMLTFLETQISIFAHTDKVARRLMTSPVVATIAENSIREAEKIMSHYRLKAIPIFRSGTQICVGVLEHEVALRAVGHGLGSVLVSAYMQRNFEVVTPETGLQSLMDIIIGTGQRLVPVVAVGAGAQDAILEEEKVKSEKENPVIGVITRTDLIHLFLDNDEIQLPKPKMESARKRNLAKMIELNTPAPCMKLLRMIASLATTLDLNIYVVGGFVRDLLMKQQEFRWPNMDIDLVVEGDAIAFAYKLAELLQGRVREHAEFLTALVIFDGACLHSEITTNKKEKGDAVNFEMRIDIATARLEYYESPAALPTVELSSIRMDLARRDFTINAMAIHLNNNNFGQLVDFFDGQSDIKNKRVRMLHSLSFVEDPTRALRAVRFEQRYNFKVGMHCDKLIRNAVELGLIDKLSGKRIYTELALILQEKDPIICFNRLQEFNILAAIHPALELATKEKCEFMANCHKVFIWYTLLYLEENIDNMFFYILSNSRNISHNDLKTLLERLAFIPTKIEEILRVRSELIRVVYKMEEWKQTQMLMSELHEIVQNLPLEALLFLSARKPASTITDTKNLSPDLLEKENQTEEMYKKLSLYIYKSRLEKIELKGEDVLSMGLEQGPQVGQILRAVLMAKMDGVVSGYEEEWYFAQNLIKNLSA